MAAEAPLGGNAIELSTAVALSNRRLEGREAQCNGAVASGEWALDDVLSRLIVEEVVDGDRERGAQGERE